jgi:PAS domain S-box-containing protein
MQKQPKQTPEQCCSKKFLVLVFILSMLLPGAAILFFVTQSNLTYPALLLFIVLYAGIFLFLLNEIAGAKKVNKALKLEKENFRTILYNIGEGLVTTDKEGQILYMNPSAERLTGWSWREAKNKPLHEIFNVVNEETGEPIEHIVSRILKDGIAIEFENNTILRAKDKHRMIISNNGSPLVDSGGNISGAVLVFNDITNRKKAEKEIRDYKFALDESSIVDVSDEKGIIRYANENFCRISKYSKEELIGQDHRILSSGYHNTAFIKNLWETVSSGKVWRAEVKNKKKDGNYYWVDTTVVPFLDSRGNPFQYISIRSDITERKETEDKLIQNEQQFRLLLDSTAQGIYGVDMDGNCTFVNAACLKILGYGKEEELLGQHIHTLIHHTRPDGSHYPSNECRMYKALSGHGGTHVSDECFWRSDGSSFPVEYWSHPIVHDEQVVGAVATFFDITERKKAEEKLLQLSQVVEQSPVSIVITDKAGFIEYVNPKFVEITGYSYDEAIGKNPRILKSGYTSGEEYKQLWETLTTGDEWHGELHNKKKDGTLYWEWATISPILNAQGETTHFLAVKEDITERKKAEEKIRKFNERFTMIAATTHDAVWEWNFEPNELWANEKHQHLYGLTTADPVPTAKMWEQKIHPDDREKVLKDFFKIFASDKNIWIAEYRFKTHNGEYINIYDRTYIIRNTDGEAIRTMGSMMDITERKKAEDALREKEFILTEAQRIAHIGSWVNELSGKITWTEETYNIYGVSPDNFIPDADSFISLLHPDDRAAMQNWINNCVAGKEPGELEFRTVLPDGTIRFLNGRGELEYNAEHKPLCMRGTVQDITERKKAEEEILEINKRLRLLSEYLQNVREEERTHMAREIHDELGQQLTVMKMDVAWLNEKLRKTDTSIRQRTEELNEMLDKTVITVRRIASELRPSMLDDMGLGAAIEWHLSEFEKRSGVKTEFNMMQSELPLPDAIKTGLFRVVQESLTNVGRYAKAKKVAISLQQKDGHLAMLIKDNGVGFDIAEKIAAKKTLGILGMTERCYIMGGTFNINSTPGKGTTITVKVPFGE